MNTTQTYVSMIEATGEDNPLSPPEMLGRFVSMLDKTDIKLETEAAWRLDPKVADKLDGATDVRPPGGWTAFVSLLAGTPWLTASRKHFEVDKLPDKDEPLRGHLVEAYTQRLVPPTAASSMFILLGLHPAWGVHLAHRMHPGSCSTKRADLFPAETLDVVETAVFQFLGTVVDGLAELEPNEAVPLDRFQRFVRAAVDFAGDQAREDAGENCPGLAPFVSRKDNDIDRIGPLLAQEWVEEVLVPAGAAERRGDCFVVDGNLLDEVEVGMADKDYGGLAEFLEATPAEASA